MVKSLNEEESTMVRSGGSAIRLKLVRVAHRHQQMKAAFNNLRSEIKTGLIEAEDVFASLSIPLMKLVGLKTDEMAQQGRSTTILTPPQPQERGQKYTSGRKLIHQQRHQLQQLVNLLRQIESRINSRQNNLLDTLEQHQFHLHNLFQNSIRHLSSLHQQTNDHQHLLLVALKLLHTTFKHAASALTCVHSGVQDLIAELAQHMCTPMSDYARSLKADMDAGALIRLVALVENMEGAQIELDQARRKAKLAEDTKLQALTMLRDSEQRELQALNKLRDSENNRMALTQFIGFLLDAKKNSKLLVMEENEAGDEKLLWDLLKEKKHVKAQANPVGMEELLHVEPSKNQGHVGDKKNSSRAEVKVSYRPVTRSFRKGLCAATPSPDAWPHLGPSPSVVEHKQGSSLLRIRKGTPRG